MHGFASGIRGGRFFVAVGTILPGIDSGAAAGQQHPIARLKLLHYLLWSQIEFDADGFSASLADSLFILRQGAFDILPIPGMRHGYGDAWGRHRLWHFTPLAQCRPGSSAGGNAGSPWPATTSARQLPR